MKVTKRVFWLIGAWVVATVATAGVALAVVSWRASRWPINRCNPCGPAGRSPRCAGPRGFVPTPTAASRRPPVPITCRIHHGRPRRSTTTRPPKPLPPSRTRRSTTAAPATTTTRSTTTRRRCPRQPRSIPARSPAARSSCDGRPSSVELVSASPNDGWSVDVEKRGPDKVEIEFEGDGVKSKYSAEVSDGEAGRADPGRERGRGLADLADDAGSSDDTDRQIGGQHLEAAERCGRLSTQVIHRQWCRRCADLASSGAATVPLYLRSSGPAVGEDAADHGPVDFDTNLDGFGQVVVECLAPHPHRGAVCGGIEEIADRWPVLRNGRRPCIRGSCWGRCSRSSGRWRRPCVRRDSERR